MGEYLVWGLLLLLQNAAFTWVSRARNSSSVWYHGVASVFSNGVYILNQGIVINKFITVPRFTPEYWFVVVFYTVFTTTGALTMHTVLMKWVEKGTRRVGA